MLPNQKDESWETHGKRLWIQTDNRQIKEVFGGRSALDCPNMRPLCIRIARSLEKLLTLGWKPIEDISDFITWDGRDYNTYADHAAKVALDLDQNWE